VVEIKVSPEEVASGSLSDAHREAAVRAVMDDGVVVLKDVVSLDHLDRLHERMLEDLEALHQRKDAPFNWNVGNIQQDPPPFPPYLFKDVLVNEQVIAVTSALLGPGVKNRYYSGNTAMPSDQRQPVHADNTHLWPHLTVAHPPAEVVVNIATVDVSPENGSTEIWPGTHLDVTLAAGQDIKIPLDVLEARRAVSPPIQPRISRGSAVIRDVRMWHAGMPNRTNQPRPMIAMIHSCSWLHSGDPLRFPIGTEAFFEHPILHTRAQFVEGPIDHIHAPEAYEFTP
jgi:hypothetical protein